MERAEIIAGDKIAFDGGRRVSSVWGTVAKASRVNLVLTTEYMGRPMELKISRHNLDGKGRVQREGVIHEVAAQ